MAGQVSTWSLTSGALAMSLEFNDYQCGVSFQEYQALSEGPSVCYLCLSESHSGLSQGLRGAWICLELAELNW